MMEKLNLEKASLRTYFSWKRCLMDFLKFILIFAGSFFIYWLLKDKFSAPIVDGETIKVYVAWDVPFICFFILLFMFFIVNIVSWIVSPFIHKDIYFLEEGIWLGKNASDGIFLEWSQIKALDCGNRSSSEQYGYVIVYTNLYPKGRRQRGVRYFIIDVKEPANICNKGMIMLMKNK